MFATLIALFYASAATAQEKATQPEHLGKVDFPVSCSATAQQRFEHALALLHSFIFPETVKAFTAVTETDPTCAMEQVYRHYPDDSEAAIFYVLAPNEAVDHADKTYARQLKAGTIIEKIFAEQPDHPGVAHYIIDAYDFPPLASRGLPAARRYTEIAPSSQLVVLCSQADTEGPELMEAKAFLAKR